MFISPVTLLCHSRHRLALVDFSCFVFTLCGLPTDHGAVKIEATMWHGSHFSSKTKVLFACNQRVQHRHHVGGGKQFCKQAAEQSRKNSAKNPLKAWVSGECNGFEWKVKPHQQRSFSTRPCSRFFFFFSFCVKCICHKSSKIQVNIVQVVATARAWRYSSQKALMIPDLCHGYMSLICDYMRFRARSTYVEADIGFILVWQMAVIESEYDLGVICINCLDSCAIQISCLRKACNF